MNLPPESQSAYLVCAFSMLGKIAAADGVVSSEEVQKVEDFIDEELQLDSKMKVLAMKVFREAQDSPLELRDYAERFQRAYPDRVHHLDSMVHILLQVSTADGQMSKTEEDLVRSAALLLGLSDPAFQRIKKEHLEKRLSRLQLPRM